MKNKDTLAIFPGGSKRTERVRAYDTTANFDAKKTWIPAMIYPVAEKKCRLCSSCFGTNHITLGNAISILFMVLTFSLVLSCSSITIGARNTLKLRFFNLDPLQNGFHYEAWIVVDDLPVSAGKFNIDQNGSLKDLYGNIQEDCILYFSASYQNPSVIYITIEPGNDNDNQPSNTPILGGYIINEEAALTIGHDSAFGNDFTLASGTYLLATPTNGPNNNEKSGIWFANEANGELIKGLQLPELRKGWVYEGWVIFRGITLSTGIFIKSGVRDKTNRFGAQINFGYPFPGEDFLQNAPNGLQFPINPGGARTFISIEPFPDDSEDPFSLVPLAASIPINAIVHRPYPLQNQASLFPSGIASLDP